MYSYLVVVNCPYHHNICDNCNCHDNDRGEHQNCIPTWLSYSRYHQNDCHDHHNCHDNEHQRCIPTWLPASAVGLATTGTSWVSLRDIIGNDHFSHEKLFISSNGDESG